MSKKDSKKAEEYFKKGHEYLKRGDFSNALKYFEKSRKIVPDNVAVNHDIGIVYYHMVEYDTALKYLKKALELDPLNLKIYNTIGSTYLRKKDYYKAIQYFEKAIQIDPKNSKFFSNIGAAYSDIEKYDKSLEYFEKSIALDPNNFDAYHNMGLLYLRKGEYENAISTLKKSLNINSNFFEALYDIGIAYLKSSNYEMAIESFEKALTTKTDDSKVYRSLGDTYLLLNEYDKAMDNYEKALKPNKENFEIYNNMGMVYLNEKKYDKAITCFEKALSLNEYYPVAHNNIGITYANMGKYDKAITCFEKALEFNPKYPEAANNIKHALNDCVTLQNEHISNGNYAMAITAYDKIINSGHISNNFMENEFFNTYYYLYKNIPNIKENIPIFENICEIISCVNKFKNKRLFKIYDDGGDGSGGDGSGLKNVKGTNNLVHYTKPESIISIMEGDPKTKKSYFRLYNSAYMNDPDEGKLILKVAEKWAENHGGYGQSKICKYYGYTSGTVKNKDCEIFGNSNEFQTFIGCFLTDSDRLYLWRTYGKDGDKNEANGMSIVLKNKFFDQKPSNNIYMTNLDNYGGENKEITIEKPVTPYAIMYTDENGLDTENTKYLLKLIDNIEKNISKLEKYDEYEKPIKIIVRSIIDEIRYLVKSKDYSEEDERRVIFTYPISNTRVLKLDDKKIPPMMYMEIEKDFKDYIEKVVIGPRVENPDYWKVYLKYHGIESEESHCNFK